MRLEQLLQMDEIPGRVNCLIWFRRSKKGKGKPPSPFFICQIDP